jgi:glycosyltransferase involved in cell wall biosynthesis
MAAPVTDLEGSVLLTSDGADGDPARQGRKLKIAMLAPPWVPVPPLGYGGIEQVVGFLTEGLVSRGHAVTLFAAPRSRSSAAVRSVLPREHPDEIERSLHEVDHVARVFDEVDRAAAAGSGFDVIHDHSGFTGVAMANRIAVPVVHTLHGPFTEDTASFYQAHGHKAHLVAISRAQQESAPDAVPIAGVVHNPIDLEEWPYQPNKQDYLLWIGRMDETKGAHRAIAAARGAGVPLVLAGPVQPGQEEYFQREVEPRVDGDWVRYVGEVGGDDKARVFAEARALLMPISWDEPFGMVMVEALACGTPVIAFPSGAAPEIVEDAKNGFLVDDEKAMAEAVKRLSDIDPAACRASADRFGVHTAAAGYERVYRSIVADRASDGAGRAGQGG